MLTDRARWIGTSPTRELVVIARRGGQLVLFGCRLELSLRLPERPSELWEFRTPNNSNTMASTINADTAGVICRGKEQCVAAKALFAKFAAAVRSADDELSASDSRPRSNPPSTPCCRTTPQSRPGYSVRRMETHVRTTARRTSRPRRHSRREARMCRDSGSSSACHNTTAESLPSTARVSTDQQVTCIEHSRQQHVMPVLEPRCTHSVMPVFSGGARVGCSARVLRSGWLRVASWRGWRCGVVVVPGAVGCRCRGRVASVGRVRSTGI